MVFKKLNLIIILITIAINTKTVLCMNDQKEANNSQTKILTQNILNLEKYGKTCFKQFFNKKIIDIKIKNNILIITFKNKEVILINLSKKTLIKKFENNPFIKSISRNNLFLFIYLLNGGQIIDLKNDRIIKEFKELKYPTQASKNNKYLLIVQKNEPDELFDFETGASIKIFDKKISNAGFDKESNFLFITYNNKKSYLISLTNKIKTINNFEKINFFRFINKYLLINYEKQNLATLLGLKNKISSKIIKLKNKIKTYSFDLDIKELSSNGLFVSITVEDKNSYATLCSLKNSTKNINLGHAISFEFSSDNNYLKINTADATTILNLTNNEELKFPFSGTKFSNKNKFVFSNPFLNSEKQFLLNLQTKTIVTTFQDPISYMRPKLGFSRNERILQTEDSNNSTKLIDSESGSIILESNEKISCGLLKDHLWVQGENNEFSLFEMPNEKKTFMKNLLDKYHKKQLCDTRITIQE